MFKIDRDFEFVFQVLHKQGSQSKREETEKINLNEKFDEEDDDDEEEESDDVTQESENDQPVDENQEPIDENVLNLLSDLALKSKGAFILIIFSAKNVHSIKQNLRDRERN